MIEIGGKIDENDVEYIRKRFGLPEYALPTPTLNGVIHPQTSRFLTKEGKKLTLVHIKPVYYKNRMGKWRPLGEVTEYHGNKNIVLNDKWNDIHPDFMLWLIQRQKKIGGVVLIPSPYRLKDTPVALTERNTFFTTTTKYPLAGSAGATTDGWVGKTWDTNWSTTQGAASGTSGYVTEVCNSAGTGDRCADVWEANLLVRYHMIYDATSIDAGDTISAATCSTYCGQKGDTIGTSVSIVVSTFTTGAAMTIDDYNNFNTTKVASDVAFGSISASAYVDYTVTSPDSNIFKSGGGVTKWGHRIATDVSNTAPGGGTRAYYYTHHADVSGTSSDPKLVIEHAAGGGGGGSTLSTLMLMGMGA